MNRNVLIIIAAAILIELFSAVQYYTAHGLVEEQLDHRAESELRTKAIVVRGILNLQESALHEHLWDIGRCLSEPDSMLAANAHIIARSRHAAGSFITFRPYFYPQKGRLFEPYAYSEGEEIRVAELGGSGEHDYTLHPAYRQVERELKPSWSDPYVYATDSTRVELSTYSYPLTDGEGRFVGICGIDLRLEQIGDTLNARHIYPSSFDLLLTAGGQVISGPSASHPNACDVAQVARLIANPASVRKPSRSGHSEVIAFDSEQTGERAYVYFANMRGEPRWKVAVVCYDDEVYGALYVMRLKVALFMLLGFGLLGFIIHRSVRSERRLGQAQVRQGAQRIVMEGAVGCLCGFIAGGSRVGEEAQVGIVEAYGVEGRQDKAACSGLVIEACQYGALMQLKERILLVTDDRIIVGHQLRLDLFECIGQGRKVTFPGEQQRPGLEVVEPVAGENVAFHGVQQCLGLLVETVGGEAEGMVDGGALQFLVASILRVAGIQQAELAVMSHRVGIESHIALANLVAQLEACRGGRQGEQKFQVVDFVFSFLDERGTVGHVGIEQAQQLFGGVAGYGGGCQAGCQT